MKQKVMIVGAGDFQIPIIEYATRLYDVIVVAPSIPPEIMNKVTGIYNVDVREKERILQIAMNERINGVITDQTDISVCTVSYVAEKMGLPGIGYEKGKLFTDKALMREKLHELNIPTLPCKKTNSVEEALEFFRTLDSEVIIRPIDSQGSRGLYRCSTEEDIVSNYPNAGKWSSDGSVLVEKYANGREFVVEGLALDYEFVNLAIGDTEYFTSQEVYAANHRIFPSNANQDVVDRVLTLNRRIHIGFGIKQGITHSEYIMDGNDIYLIETAARGGGVFISSDLLPLATGINTEEFLLNISLGKQTEFPVMSQNECCCGYLAFFIPKGTVNKAEGIKEVQALPYVYRNQLDKIYKGMTIGGNPRDKTSRYAVTVSAKNRKELHERMDIIKSLLNITVIEQGVTKGLIWN